MSKAYAGDWKDPSELPGVGQYCRDSWSIFVEGRKDVRPRDGMLADYVAWLRRGGNNDRLVAKYRRNLKRQRNKRC